MSEQGILIIQPCPASIWLLGTVVGCKVQGPHTQHKVVIEWTTAGTDDA